jgi:hypothetical protein
MAVIHNAGPTHFDALVDALGRSREPRRLVTIAKTLGMTQDRRAVGPLLAHLSDGIVQKTDQIEQAFCRALTELGVMQQVTTGRYGFKPRHELSPGVVELLTELDEKVPLRYFIVGEDRRSTRRCRHDLSGECPYCHEHE